jgi:hypothetical protein
MYGNMIINYTIVKPDVIIFILFYSFNYKTYSLNARIYGNIK